MLESQRQGSHFGRRSSFVERDMSVEITSRAERDDASGLHDSGLGSPRGMDSPNWRRAGSSTGRVNGQHFNGSNFLKTRQIEWMTHLQDVADGLMTKILRLRQILGMPDFSAQQLPEEFWKSGVLPDLPKLCMHLARKFQEHRLKLQLEKIDKAGLDMLHANAEKFSGRLEPWLFVLLDLMGCEVLKRIAASLENDTVQSELEQLTSEFYTVIPHDFGFKKMRDSIIDTPQLVKTKLEMVEALGEIEVATKILEVDKEEEIKSNLPNAHGETHYFSLSAEHIFKVVRDGEDGLFQPFAGTKNRLLLWHGSRMCNWMGILSQGLRIAPREAPVSGYMFGKGVYFADMVSESAQYCYPSGDKLGLLLLCEVALGDMRELDSCDYHADRLPPGKLSTKGVGSTAPDPKQFKVLPDGVIVPMGTPAKQNVTRASLQYNAYIVYNTSQIRTKYVLMVKFKNKE